MRQNNHNFTEAQTHLRFWESSHVKKKKICVEVSLFVNFLSTVDNKL